MVQSPKSRKYVFTINNPTAEDLSLLEQMQCRYVIYGEEQGENGTVHLQGFVYFQNKITRKTVSRSLPRAFIEPARGSFERNIEYCSKGEQTHEEFQEMGKNGPAYGVNAKVVERGNRPIGAVGKKCTLAERAERNKTLMSGSLLSLVEDGEICITQVPLLKRARMALAQETSKYEHPTVRGLWIYGPPGTGKSHYARTLSDNYYMKHQNKWFDGYQGEHVIILDDMDSDCIAHKLKLWADKYHVMGETKGGHVNLVHRLFVVTSNYTIRELIKCPTMAEAIERRFEVKHMMVKYKPE